MVASAGVLASVFTDTMILSLTPNMPTAATDLSAAAVLPTVTTMALTGAGAGMGSAGAGAGSTAAGGVTTGSSFFLQPAKATVPTSAAAKA